MRKIAKLLKQGWTITEIRFDHWQGWYYLAASHESGEATAESAGQSLDEGLTILLESATKKTPAWFTEQNISN